MRRRYVEFNGRSFPFQADLDLAGQVLDFILAHGDEALRALRQMEGDPDYSDALREMLEQGLLEKARGRFRLTPRAINAMQRRALMEIFAHLRRGARDGHAARDLGGGGERAEGTRPYQFGDPVSELDAQETLRNALRRGGADRAAGGGVPRLRLSEADFALHNSESRTSCSTVILLDQSGSMARFGRFLSAKKCAMALTALIRQRFPMDTVDTIGFYSGAAAIPEDRLPLCLPKPVSVHDPRIRLRVPIPQIDAAPQHFTNLHLGLLHAGRVLRRRAGENKMVLIITDGQPTAHVQGDAIHLIYPPHESSHYATLREALALSRTGVRLCTFALTDDYWDMDWLGFVEQLGKLTRGVVFHCTSGDLSACVMESYLSGRRKKTYLA